MSLAGFQYAKVGVKGSPVSVVFMFGGLLFKCLLLFVVLCV